MTLNFIAAVFNEEAEIRDLLNHVHKYVDGMYIVDDGSTDSTLDIMMDWKMGYGYYNPELEYQTIDHTGLCEVARIRALEMVPDGSWVLMLDADERFAPGVLDAIRTWLRSVDSTRYSHVYFSQVEFIDGQAVRTFQKVKLFRKDFAHLPEMIHADPQFDGDGIYKADWVVLHRKTSDKQRQREREYLDTYKKLLEEGKIDEGRHEWMKNLHYYERGE